MCSLPLTVRVGRAVVVDVFHGRRLVEHGRFQSSTADDIAFAAIRRADVTPAPGAGLPPGRYRCRVSEAGQVIGDRSFTVFTRLSPQATAQNHYSLVALDPEGRPITDVRVHEPFRVQVTSADLRRRAEAKLALCVNTPRAILCRFFVLGPSNTRVIPWIVLLNEGAGAVYRLTLDVGRRELAHLDLRLAPNTLARSATRSMVVRQSSGLDELDLTVAVRDGNGFPVPGKLVRVVLPRKKHAKVSPAAATPDLHGAAAFAIHDGDTETVVLQVRDETDALIIRKRLRVDFPDIGD